MNHLYIFPPAGYNVPKKFDSFEVNFMKSEKRAVTMSDVAQEAGVALGTVSKVINGLPVGESYRRKVEAAVEKLDYRVNPNAKALKSNRTNTIGLILPNTIIPFFALLTHYVNMALERRGYKMMLCFSEYDRDREQELISMVVQNRVDGIIALTYNPRLEIPENVPFVTIDRFLSVSVPCVSSDNFGGGQLAAKKLAELGCRRVACLQVGSVLTTEPNKRKDGFISGCMAAGLPFEICNPPDFSDEKPFEIFLHQQLVETDTPLDGLFCATDLVAYQSMRIIRSLGLRVPEDIQIIGFDGLRVLGDQEPVCSSIAQPIPDLAETAVSLVLSNDFTGLPPLLCLPVSYQPGGTTRDSVK